MCDPVTAGLAGLQAIGAVSDINNQNDAAVANAQNAKRAANEESASTTEQYIEQQRSLIQGGFDAVLEGREAESMAYASAIENGVQGASVKAALRNQKQKTGRSQSRTSQEMQSLRTQTGTNLRHIGEKTKGRIASVPTTSFGLGDAAQVLTPIVRSQME